MNKNQRKKIFFAVANTAKIECLNKLLKIADFFFFLHKLFFAKKKERLNCAEEKIIKTEQKKKKG